jgi:hypothetical protein
MFFQQRASTQATGIPSLDYATAKDDLDLNLIQLIKAQTGGGAPMAEEKVPDPADEEEDDNEAIEAARLAAEAAMREEAERQAAEDAMRAAVEAQEAEAAARAVAEAEAAAAAAAASTSTKIEGDHDASDFGDDW